MNVSNLLGVIVVSLFSVFGARAAEAEKDVLTVDLTCQGGNSFCRGYDKDITKLQDKDLPARIEALKVGDTILFNSPDGVFTGTCALAYRDINLVEVRAGYFFPHNKENGDIWRFTYDQDQMLGQVDYTYVNHEYGILYNPRVGLTSLSRSNAKFTCGNCTDTLDRALALDGVEKAKSRLAAAESVSAANYYTNDWQSDEYVTQNYMIVYTKEAMQEAEDRGGINNVMAQGIVLGTLILSNSQVRTCLSLVHSGLVDYPNPAGETCDSSRALLSLSSSKNGLEVIEGWRARYGADMCSIAVKDPSYTGLAYVCGSVNGSESAANNCMDVNFVNTTGWVHEDGHNMGGNHYDEKGTSKGGLYGHSHGCHNTPPGAKMEFGSVMARSEGLFNYFSSTNIFYDGVPISTNVKCQAALCWEKLRRYASRYRSVPYHTVGGLVCKESFSYSDTIRFGEGGMGFASPWYDCNTNAFAISPDNYGEDWGSHEGGSLKVSNSDPKEQMTVQRCLHWKDISPANPGTLGKTSLWFSAYAGITEKTVSAQNMGFYIDTGKYTRMAILALSSDGLVYACGKQTSLTHEIGSVHHYLVLCDFKSSATYVWVDPDMSSKPSLESADYKGSLLFSYLDSMSFLTLSVGLGIKGAIDEIEMGYTFESLVNNAQPYQFAAYSHADNVTLNWLNQVGTGNIELYRNSGEDFPSASLLKSGGADFQSYVDRDLVAGQTYFYWIKGGFGLTEPRKGIIGLPDVSAEANGEYTVGQGQTAHLSAAGSKGFEPSVRWLIGSYKSLFSTNNCSFNYDGDQIYWPGDYKVEVRVTDRAYRTCVCTNYSMLHVTNSFPGVFLERNTEDRMAGISQLFTAHPKDPGIHDVLSVRFDFGDGSGFSEWTNCYYVRHTYEEAGNYSVVCQVRDNYGAVSETNLAYSVRAAAALPLIPDSLTLENGRSALLAISNLGSVDFDFAVENSVSSMDVSPLSGTVSYGADGMALLLVEINPLATGGLAKEFHFKVKANGQEKTVTVSVPASPEPIVCCNGPYEVAYGDCACLDGSGSAGGYHYAWFVNDEQIGVTSDSFRQNILIDAPIGTNKLALAIVKKSGIVLSKDESVIVVKGKAPGVYLEEASRNGNNVTYCPCVISGGHEDIEVRYNWDNGMGFTKWQEPQAISHVFDEDRSYYVQCQIRQGERENATALYFNPADTLAVKAAFASTEGRELTVPVGKAVALTAQVPSGTRALWRQDPEACLPSALDLAEGETVTCRPLEAGTYYFACYAASSAALSSPSLLKLTATESQDGGKTFALGGILVTNTYFGSGPYGKAYARVLGDSLDIAVSNSQDGTFLFDGLPCGKVLLNVGADGYEGVLREFWLTNGSQTVNLTLNANGQQGYAYANVSHRLSNFPLEGATVKAGSAKTSSNAKGKTGALTLPYGQYAMSVKLPGRPLYCTNIVIAKGVSNYPAKMAGYTPSLSGTFYGTGTETVLEGQIQVLDKQTQNIVQRWNLDGIPFYDLHLNRGSAATLRLRPQDYDKENVDMTLQDSAYRDFVLTPEPGCLMALLGLLLAVLRQRGKGL